MEVEVEEDEAGVAGEAMAEAGEDSDASMEDGSGEGEEEGEEEEGEEMEEEEGEAEEGEEGEEGEGEGEDEEEDEGEEEDENASSEDEAVEGSMGAPTETETSMAAHRLSFLAEERVYAAQQRALDVASLEAYLAASSACDRVGKEEIELRESAEASAKRLQRMLDERSRKFLRGIEMIGTGLQSTFRSLCKHGDCQLEYSAQPTILFTEGVSIVAKPPRAEWSRFEQLSGGQQALVAVALNLALHEADSSPFCLFDEIDAALDTERVQALAKHVRTRVSSQTLFVSHRKELIEASGRLIGTYSLDGGAQAVSMSFT